MFALRARPPAKYEMRTHAVDVHSYSSSKLLTSAWYVARSFNESAPVVFFCQNPDSLRNPEVSATILRKSPSAFNNCDHKGRVKPMLAKLCVKIFSIALVVLLVHAKPSTQQHSRCAPQCWCQAWC